MHLPTCLVCGEKTDDGVVVDKKLRPLCMVHRLGGVSGFLSSKEMERVARQSADTVRPSGHGPRAFMDWLNRVRAERRNASAA